MATVPAASRRQRPVVTLTWEHDYAKVLSEYYSLGNGTVVAENKRKKRAQLGEKLKAFEEEHPDAVRKLLSGTRMSRSGLVAACIATDSIAGSSHIFHSAPTRGSAPPHLPKSPFSTLPCSATQFSEIRAGTRRAPSAPSKPVRWLADSHTFLMRLNERKTAEIFRIRSAVEDTVIRWRGQSIAFFAVFKFHIQHNERGPFRAAVRTREQVRKKTRLLLQELNNVEESYHGKALGDAAVGAVRPTAEAVTKILKTGEFPWDRCARRRPGRSPRFGVDNPAASGSFACALSNH